MFVYRYSNNIHLYSIYSNDLLEPLSVHERVNRDEPHSSSHIDPGVQTIKMAICIIQTENVGNNWIQKEPHRSIKNISGCDRHLVHIISLNHVTI